MKQKLRVRRRLYDDTEYENIKDRIKQCERHVEAERRSAIKEEATRVVERRRKGHGEAHPVPIGQYNVRALREAEEK